MSYKLKDIIRLLDYDEPILVCLNGGWDSDDCYTYQIWDIPSDTLEMEVFEIFGTQYENVGFLLK